jgi:hypothetical protein
LVGLAAGRVRVVRVRPALPMLVVGGCFAAAAVVAVRALDTSLAAPGPADLLVAMGFGIATGAVIAQGVVHEQSESGSDDVP